MPGQKPNINADSLTEQHEIEALCLLCRKEGRFAFDTEFVMEDRYQPEACLIQVATSKTVSLIDPFLDLDLEPVWSLVTDADVEVVVHAGQEDLALAVQHIGLLPRRVFDVQLAAGLVGYDYPISLQKLVQATKHIRLHKSKTLTDWRKRPLTKAQLRYAAEDVLHLLEVQRILTKKLDRLSRLEWAREEFQRFEQHELYERAEEDKIFRVKGTGAMEGKQLAIVRDVLEWRDSVGHRYNRPVRIILKDHLIAEIARH
ncbi:MAG: ribonuclease D, partial [Planctomycetota bacterium]